MIDRISEAGNPRSIFWDKKEVQYYKDSLGVLGMSPEPSDSGLVITEIGAFQMPYLAKDEVIDRKTVEGKEAIRLIRWHIQALFGPELIQYLEKTFGAINRVIVEESDRERDHSYYDAPSLKIVGGKMPPKVAAIGIRGVNEVELLEPKKGIVGIRLFCYGESFGNEEGNFEVNRPVQLFATYLSEGMEWELPRELKLTKNSRWEGPFDLDSLPPHLTFGGSHFRVNALTRLHDIDEVKKFYQKNPDTVGEPSGQNI